MIAPDGWIAQALGKGLAGGMAALFGLLWLALFAWIFREWISARRRNRYSELFVYVFAAAGAVYVLLVLTGEPF
jgi:thiol:disulfide interchange protein